jgi:hypothetical protein
MRLTSVYLTRTHRGEGFVRLTQPMSSESTIRPRSESVLRGGDDALALRLPLQLVRSFGSELTRIPGYFAGPAVELSASREEAEQVIAQAIDKRRAGRLGRDRGDAVVVRAPRAGRRREAR